jgi:hypothetical protein
VRQIPWDDNEQFLKAWEDGRTGYPWIDAIMAQLHSWGWMHHLARHSVACFLTRGDLWCPWERGRDVFDKYLIDADFFVNNGARQQNECRSRVAQTESETHNEPATCTWHMDIATDRLSACLLPFAHRFCRPHSCISLCVTTECLFIPLPLSRPDWSDSLQRHCHGR